VPADSSEATLAALAFDFAQVPGVRPLAAAYAAGTPEIAPFFNGLPGDDDAWNAAVSAARAAHPDRPVIEALTAQLAGRGAPNAAKEALARLADPTTVAVVTGQQAGLFGGPLYTLLKAITALRLARRLEANRGVPAVAVFWVDAEDHDLDEIRSCEVIGPDGQPAAVSIALPPSAAGTPASTVTLGNESNTLLDQLSALLASTDFTESLLGKLRTAYGPGHGLVEGFARWLEQLLGRHGLVVFDASDPAAKQHVADLFEREITTKGHTAVLASSAGEALEAAGFHAQVTPKPNSLALFVTDGTRQAVRCDDDELLVGDTKLSREALLARLATDPTAFGPNVLLRPLVQDRLFPTVCYVAGPNELAYLAQLKDVYAHFDIPMPLVANRLTATLVDTAVVKFLRRHEMSLAELGRQDEAALNQLLTNQLPASVEQTLEIAGTNLKHQLDLVSTAVATVDPTLKGAAGSTLGRMERELRNLQSKVVQAAKRRDQTLRRQFQRAQSQLFPGGGAQERSLAGVYFLNKYGDALIDRLLNDPELDTDRHWIITI